MKTLTLFALLIVLTITPVCVPAQTPETVTPEPNVPDEAPAFSLVGYVDGYYRFDGNFDSPRQVSYFYASARHNQFAVNLALLDLKYTAERVRARIAPGFGTYMADNYAAEPAAFRHIYEASAGVKPFKKVDMWLDAGVLGSPFGYEGAISRDQMAYTRSFSAENSPYYVTGARLSARLSSAVSASVYVLNGWQNIEENNAAKSLATQVQITPNDKLLLNFSGYIGDENTVDTLSANHRLFADFYAAWQPTPQLQLLALFDVGLQNATNDATLWHTANMQARFRLAPAWHIAARAEYFSDPKSSLIVPATGIAPGFEVYGGSLNVDFDPAPNVTLRLEGRYLAAPTDVFLTRDAPSRNSTSVTASLAVSI